MKLRISHDWIEETTAAKDRWFHSLTPEERFEVFSDMYELAMALDPTFMERELPIETDRVRVSRLKDLKPF